MNKAVLKFTFVAFLVGATLAQFDDPIVDLLDKYDEDDTGDLE